MQKVLFLKIEQDEQTIERVYDQNPLVIGRSTEAHIGIADPGVSRTHLEISIKHGRVWLNDLGSANGTFINGKKITPKIKVAYNDGDAVQLGSQRIKVTIHTLEKAFDLKSLEASDLNPDQKENLLTLVNSAHAEANRISHLVKGQTDQSLKATEAKINGLISQANFQADQIISLANNNASKIQEDAKRKQVETVLRAESEAMEATAEVFRKAEHVVQEAEEKAQQIILQAEQTSKEKYDITEQEATQLLQQARQNIQDLRVDWEKEMENLTEAAKKRARQIEGMAQQKAEEAISSADRQKLNILNHANELFDHAKKDAQDRSVQYYAQAENELKATQKKAQEIIIEAHQQVKTIHINIDKEISSLKETLLELKKDRSENEVFLNEAKETLADLTLKTEDSKKELSGLENKRESLSLELSQFKKELAEVLEQRKTAVIEADQVKKDAQRFKEQIDKETQDLKDAARKEIETFKSRESEALDKAKLDEIKKIKEMRLASDRSLNRHRSELVGEFLRLTESHILALLKPSLPNSYDWNVVNQRLQTEVKESLNEAIYKYTNIEVEKDSQEIHHQKSVTFLKNFKIAALSSAALLAFLFALPSSRHFISNFLKRNSSDTAAQNFSKQMQTERARRFDPPKTEAWHDNYTDSLLYTRGYTDLKLDAQFQDQWIHDLHEYLYTKLRVDEDSIVKLVSLEAAMVTKLKEEADSIHPDYVEQQVKKMREMEQESVSQMQTIIGSNAKFENFKKFSENYYYKEFLKRSPAQIQNRQ